MLPGIPPGHVMHVVMQALVDANCAFAPEHAASSVAQKSAHEVQPSSVTPSQLSSTPLHVSVAPGLRDVE